MITREITEDDLKILELDDRISHLSLGEINELVRDYNNKIKIKDILDKYSIKGNPSALYRILPPIIANVECEHCGCFLVKNQEGRSGGYYWNHKQYFCYRCNHTNQESCRCTTCEEVRILQDEREKRRLRQEIEETFCIENYKKIDESNLAPEDRFYLAAILRVCLDESLTHLIALEKNIDLISPTRELTEKILGTLVAKDILKIHPLSDSSAFVNEREGVITKYYPMKVNYHINVRPFDDSYNDMIKRLMYPDKCYFQIEPEFCYDSWKEIALNECLQFLLYRMKKVGFDFTVGKKTETVFCNLLEKYSVAQIYNIIYRSVASASQFYLECKVPKKHAANSVITKCEAFGEKAFSDGWVIKGYGRNFDLPQTELSKVLFNNILNISDLGFTEIPSRVY